MKVVVDYDLCEANAVCVDQAPEVFRVDENDNLHILIENPSEALRKKVGEAGGDAALIETVRGVGYRVTDRPQSADMT